MMLWDIKLH